jgi:DNA-binding NtrC family response regulator
MPPGFGCGERGPQVPLKPGREGVGVLDRNPGGPMPYERRSRHPVILCVDDDRGILSALRRSLSGEPYEVITAQGADEALCWFGELPIDVIITDQRMPGTEGTQLLREVVKRYPKTARAILTAYPGPALIQEGLKVGTDTFLYKPWSDSLLRDTIRFLLESSSRRNP